MLSYVAALLRPQPRLLCRSLPNFFSMRNADVSVQTNSITVQNVGRRAARQVEIVQKPGPQLFELYPNMAYSESTGPGGEHIIRVRGLKPREWVVIHMLSYRDPPLLNDIRCDDGTVQWVQIAPQRVWPKWLCNAVMALTVIGFLALTFWLAEALSYLGRLLP